MSPLPLIKTRYKFIFQNLPEKNLVFHNGSSDIHTSISQRKKHKFLKFLFLDILALLVMLLLIYMFYFIFKPPKQYFMLSDPSISYPVLPVIIPNILLGILLTIPFFLILFSHILFWWNRIDFYTSILGQLLAYVIAVLLTSFMWSLIGGLRPTFLSVCNVDYSRVTSLTQYYTQDICSTKNLSVDVFHGFPSGHASTAFAGYTFFACYLAARTRLYYGARIWKILLFLSCLIIASYIAFSRYSDKSHSANQLLLGSFIGIFTGFFTYRMLFLNGFFFGHGRNAHISFLHYL